VSFCGAGHLLPTSLTEMTAFQSARKEIREHFDAGKFPVTE
jgi:hypothetical protein